MPPNNSNLFWPEIRRYLKKIVFQEIWIVRTRNEDLTWVIDFQKCLASLALRTYWQKWELFNGYKKSFIEWVLYIKYVLLKTNYRSPSYDLTPFAQPWYLLEFPCRDTTPAVTLGGFAMDPGLTVKMGFSSESEKESFGKPFRGCRFGSTLCSIGKCCDVILEMPLTIGRSKIKQHIGVHWLCKRPKKWCLKDRDRI